MHQNKLEKIARTMYIYLHQLSHLYIIHIRVSSRFGYNLWLGKKVMVGRFW